MKSENLPLREVDAGALAARLRTAIAGDVRFDDGARALYAADSSNYRQAPIGVVIPHFDLSGLLASWEVRDDSIASHPYKLMGSPTRELSEEERAQERELLSGLVNESFERFKQVVREGRPDFRNDKSDLDDVATGQIFSADQAVANGLVDRIGFIEDAVARAAELAGTPADNLRCVEYVQPPGALDALLGTSAESVLEGRGSFDLAALLDLAAPRAYYLSSWLPAVVRNAQPN